MNYTSKEQSKRLIELGLSPETADMYYEDDISIVVGHSWHERHIPCWSVGALLEVMPKLGVYPTFDLDREKPSIFYLNDGTYQDEVVFGSTLLETTFNMVVWLLENNYIKKI